MRVPTPVGDQATSMSPFILASATLATAAGSLSKAAQAMAEAALAMSQASKVFSAMDISATSISIPNKSASGLSDEDGSESVDLPDESSGYCGSEFGSQEGDLCKCSPVIFFCYMLSLFKTTMTIWQQACSPPMWMRHPTPLLHSLAAPVRWISRNFDLLSRCKFHQCLIPKIKLNRKDTARSSCTPHGLKLIVP